MWRLDRSEFERRPLMIVEDHLYHTIELVAALARVRPDLVRETTAVVLDRSGPDTDAGVAESLARYPQLQMAAPVAARSRVHPMLADDIRSVADCARAIARLVRPGGLLVQDIQLTTLPFLSADRWWESIYLAATVRGLFADRPPMVRFLSNKRGYEATFGRDLIDAGFDPREVMDKATLADAVVPTVAAAIDRAFPFELRVQAGSRAAETWPVANTDTDRAEIGATLDLVLWPGPTGADLAGRLVSGGSQTVRGVEAETWHALVADFLGAGDGIPVLTLGRRIGPSGAERAELTNLAARHMHTVRGRLDDAAAIVTHEHRYRLRAGLAAGVVSTRPSGDLPRIRTGREGV